MKTSWYQWLMVFIAVDGVVLAAGFGINAVKKWINRRPMAFIGVCLILVGIEGFLLCVLPSTEQETRLSQENGLGKGRETVPPIKQPAPPPPATYDFETDVQGWGEHPEGGIHNADLGVKRYRGDAPRAKNGEWVLEFNTTDPGNHDAYVTVLEDPAEREVTAWVYVPHGADINARNSRGKVECSTVKIIVWAKDGHSEESGFIKLTHGVWQRIAWRPGKGEWEEFGLHFFWVGSYRRPVYIDSVNLSK